MDTKPNTVVELSGVPDPRPDSTPSRSARIWNHFCERLFGGLMLVLPLVITFWILRWFFLLLEKEFIDPLALALMWKLKWTTSSTELPYWFETFAAPVIATLLAVVVLYSADYLAETRFRRCFSWLLAHVPVVSHVYNPVRKMFESMQKPSGDQSPKRMVLIPFPHLRTKLPAFVTATSRDRATNKVILCVYVPTTPVPTSGFFLLVPEEEVTELDWKPEDALQAIMSGGLTSPPFISYFSGGATLTSKMVSMEGSSLPPPQPQADSR